MALGDSECALAASEVLSRFRSSTDSAAPQLGLSSLLTSPPRVALLDSPRGESRVRASSIESFKVGSMLLARAALDRSLLHATHAQRTL